MLFWVTAAYFRKSGSVALLGRWREIVLQSQWKQLFGNDVFSRCVFAASCALIYSSQCWVCLLFLLLLKPFNFSPVCVACRLQDWECVALREIDFRFKQFAGGINSVTFVETSYSNIVWVRCFIKCGALHTYLIYSCSLVVKSDIPVLHTNAV